jgi:uncharacterized protein
MAELKVGSASLGRTGTAHGWLRLGDLPHGRPMEVPVILVKGAHAGPTVWLQAGIHGNEYSGTFIIHEFIRQLDPAKLKGAIAAIPAVNITAYQSGTRGSPFDIYGGSDMNRVFPGKADGTMTEQMAHHLYTAFKGVANAFIDFHTAWMASTRWSLFTKVPGEVGERAEAMARAFGYPVILPCGPHVLPTSMFTVAAQAGIPGLMVEAGGKNFAFTAEQVIDGAQRLRNVVRKLGLLEEPLDAPQGKSVFIKEFAWVRSTRGGLFQPLVNCGDRVEKGQVVGRHYDLFGTLVEEARTPYSGIVVNMFPGPVMVSGETLVHVGLEPREA